MQIIYSTLSHGKIGEVRPCDNGMVAIFLDAMYWPEVTRDDKEGDQYMGEFHTFDAFKIDGSFSDLTLIDQGNYIDDVFGLGIPIFP